MEWNNNGDEASWPRAREEERGVERKREEKGGKAKIGAARWRNEGGVISRRNKREEEERERAGNLSSTPEKGDLQRRGFEFTASESRRMYKVPTSRENHLFRVRVVDKPACLTYRDCVRVQGLLTPVQFIPNRIHFETRNSATNARVFQTLLSIERSARSNFLSPSLVFPHRRVCRANK